MIRPSRIHAARGSSIRHVGRVAVVQPYLIVQCSGFRVARHTGFGDVPAVGYLESLAMVVGLRALMATSRSASPHRGSPFFRHETHLRDIIPR